MPKAFSKYKANKYLLQKCQNDACTVSLKHLKKVWKTALAFMEATADDTEIARNQLRKMKQCNTNIRGLKAKEGIFAGRANTDVKLNDAEFFLHVSQDTATYQFFLLILLGMVQEGDAPLFLLKRLDKKRYDELDCAMQNIVNAGIRNEMQALRSKNRIQSKNNSSNSNKRNQNTINNILSDNESVSDAEIGNIPAGAGYDTIQDLSKNNIFASDTGRSCDVQQFRNMPNYYNSESKIIKTRQISFDSLNISDNFEFSDDNSPPLANKSTNKSNSKHNSNHSNRNSNRYNKSNNKSKNERNRIQTIKSHQNDNNIHQKASKNNKINNNNKSNSHTASNSNTETNDNNKNHNTVYNWGEQIGYKNHILKVFENVIDVERQLFVFELINSIKSQQNPKWKLLPAAVSLLQCQNVAATSVRIAEVCKILNPKQEASGFARVANPDKAAKKQMDRVCFQTTKNVPYSTDHNVAFCIFFGLL